MRVVKKLPLHLLHTEQSGGKFPEIYAAMAKLETGNAICVEMEDVGAETMHELNKACHSCQQTWHVRKGATERFSVRRDNEHQVAYIVRKS